jgi:hypothetical protein
MQEKHRLSHFQPAVRESLNAILQANDIEVYKQAGGFATEFRQCMSLHSSRTALSIQHSANIQLVDPTESEGLNAES